MSIRKLLPVFEHSLKLQTSNSQNRQKIWKNI